MLVEMNLCPSPPPIAFTTITDSERLLVTWRILEHNGSSSTFHFWNSGYSHYSLLCWMAKHEGRQVEKDGNSLLLSATKQSWREGWWSAWQLTRIIWIPEFITQFCIPSATTGMTTQFMLHSTLLHRLLIFRIRRTRSQFSPTNTQQLLIVRQLTQGTHRKRLAILEVSIELLL